nr:MAG TPA: YopX protein [Caudoviricetes sp.]
MIPNFRAWLKKEKEMIDVDEIHWYRGKFEFIGDGITFQRLADEVELMQSTGLKDKNGKEIFEGDVAYNGFRKTIVNYGKQAIEEEFGAIREYVGFNLTLACGYPEAVPMNYEIIGNIYENPELLE